MRPADVINIAQIGCGYWGPNLLRNLVSNQRCVVSKVVDQSAERRAFVKRTNPLIEVTGNLSDVFDDDSISAVVIATPVATHYELAMQALTAGKHVLVEKPMATSSREVGEIAGVAGGRKLVAMVGHTFLYNGAVRYLKQLVDSGALGQLRYIYSQRLNLGRIRSDVDALWNFAPHDVSIIQYLLGNCEATRVRADGMDYVQPGINDVVFLHIEYPGKVMAHIHVSWLDPHKIRTMTIVGTRKMVVYDDVADNKIAIYDKGIEPRAVLGEKMDFDQLSAMKFDYRSGDVVLPKVDMQEPLRVELDHFLDCIAGKCACLTGTDHAMKVVHVLERASKEI